MADDKKEPVENAVYFTEEKEQRADIPEHYEGPCPKCGSKEVEDGYGLAGGGMGSYTCCAMCGTILSKRQDAGE